MYANACSTDGALKVIFLNEIIKNEGQSFRRTRKIYKK